MADRFEEARIKGLETRVRTLEQLLGESISLIQRLANEMADLPVGNTMNIGNLAGEARQLAERARVSGIDVKQW